jgi:GT2 family glycosyltransferase
VHTNIVVVGNGWEPADLPNGVAGLALPKNIGIPAGRNAGVSQVTGEILFFLDDDAELPNSHFLERMAALMSSRPEIGLVQPRVVDPTGEQGPGRWVPRLRVGDPKTPSAATSLWEGATVIRRSVFDLSAGWPEQFFYAHEGIDLVWRVWDNGFIPWYAGDIDVYHPVINPLRHEEFYRMNARNRVWLARRNLPVVLEPIYVGSWAALTMLRVRDSGARKAWIAGMREGIAVRPRGRKTMKWKTVWAMTKAGRPPVI